MPSIRISKKLNDKIYFLTLTVKNWYYILDRHKRWDIIANTLKYFQENRELKIYGFVFMINHIHLLIYSPDATGFVRDFKKFTTRELLKNIEQSEPSMLKLFTIEAGKELWQKTNMPELVETEKFFLQKLDYIQQNPVKRNYVARPEHWYWSSANKECDLKADDLENVNAEK